MPPSASLRHRFAHLLMAATATVLPALGIAGWNPVGTLRVPAYPYSFLATTPNGDLVATTHNYAARGQATQGAVQGEALEIPALLIRNPTSDKPEVIELLRTRFDHERGYAGIASDMTGSLYVTGDTGEVTRSFLRKFNPDGSVDTRFGSGGTILPQRRCLGVETIGAYVLLAVDWGIVLVYDAPTGRLLGRLPQQVKNLYMRDITVDPRSFRIFGVAQGGVVTWGNGVPWNPTAYDFRIFSPPLGKPEAGEGISMDPFQRCLLVVPKPGQVLYEVFGNRTAAQTKITTAAPDARLVDTAVAFDGQTLFVSDVTDRKIHVLRRTEEEIQSPVAIPLAAAAPPLATGPVNPITWYQSYDLIVRSARENRLPMLIYFRSQAPASKALETSVLQSDDFYRAASRTICVWSDAEKDRLLAYKFGVIRAPSIVVLDPTGNPVAQFRGNITKEQVLAALGAVARQAP